MGNPSDHVETPLTGGYLLIVLAEPRSAEHKLAILKKLTKGLSCWNYEESGVDIVTEFNAIVNQNIEGEEGKNGEQLFQYASDNLVAEILINPQHSTLVQCVRNLLASFTKYRCIIHAGYSFTENGSWILQDGSFSVTDFLDAYKTAEAQRTIRLHENQIRIELHCSADADWNQVSRVKGTRFLLNPPEKIVDIESIESIVRWLCDKIEVTELDILLEGSQVVGNIRFSRPTLYVFPAGQGDSALFGINGFNMLIDGGAGRNSCFWGFARHLDRLDAVLLTRLNSSNLEGVASFLKRKTMSSLYPQIGHFFCNFKTRKQISSPNIDAKQDVLSISLIDTAQSIITDLKQLQLRPHLCYRNINLEPINLYHKVGHGKLDMYVLNPSKDSKEVKDFLTKWNEGDQKLFNPTKDLQFPLPNIISVCTLLVWQPANPNTTITRILFPGSSPQNKIFESLERVRHLDFLKHPSCSIKSMSSSTSVTVKSQTTKKTVLEKMIPGETKTVKTLENLEVSTSASNAVIQTAIIPTVPKEGTPKPKFSVETEKPKQSIKLVLKETANAKPKIEHKYSSISAKVNSNKIVQKSSTTKKSLKLSSKSPPTDKSSPTTPIENQEKAPKPIKQVIKSKSTSTTTKSPSSTPTKSKKEEANRKVLVSSRTNSGLKRTPITKKETKPANPKITETSLKKDSNIVYKSSLISCNKDKSGEEEDILIVEKVAITPEKLLTPDGKKIIANELDGILTTAKDIVTKEKLSDSGATTAPTMPEDEKITESKKEIEINETDKKVEEFKKAKDALKTPDEVADLPFHEEADEQKPKATEKEIESEIETQEIVQVENAEYVLVSLDSSPEVLKRQVLDTVGLLDTELEEDSDKEDEYVETKQSTILPDIDEKTKLIEHLLESSKDLCEITEKIDELKKQNEHEITNHQIHEHLQNSNHDNTKTSNCTQLNKQEKPTQIQEAKIKIQEKKNIDEQRLNIDNENEKDIHESGHVEEYNAEKEENTQDLKQITTTQGADKELENVENITMDKKDSKASSKAGSVCDEPLTSIRSRSGSKTEEPEINTENSTEKQRSKAPSKAGSIGDEPLKSPGPDISTHKIRSSSICQEQDKTNNVQDKQESKASSKAGSVCDEPVKSPVHETITSANEVPSRSGSITEEPENTNVTDMQSSKVSSKASSICDEPVKSPVDETITTAKAVPSRSGSKTEEREITIDKQGSNASSLSNSVVEELTISPGPEISTDKSETKDGSSLVSQVLDITHVSVTDKQESKSSSKPSSVCDELVKSPIHQTITSVNEIPNIYGSITREPEKVTDMQRSKSSSKASSICEEPVKSPVHETIAANDVINRSVTVRDESESIPDNDTNIKISQASSKASSVCDEAIKSPIHEIVNEITSKSSPLTHEIENATKNQTVSKASSKSNSVCDEPIKSPIHETITPENAVPSRSGSITVEPENNTDIQRSKTSSKASSICEDLVKSPVDETIASANSNISRSGSVTEKPESIPDNVTNIQRSKASSKANSISDELVKSPVHEKVNEITSISNSTSHEAENTIKYETGSKASSKASSVCDEPLKSPVHETITSENAVPSRSGSIIETPENTPENVPDMQRSKTSSKASSICDEPVKSPVDETIASANSVISRSGSVTEKPESIPDNVNDIQRSKASSKASSISDELIKSPVHEKVNEITSKSSSLTHELDNTIKNSTGSEASSRAGSVCDEPVKSPVHTTITSENSFLIKSGSITAEPENVPDMQRSKTSSKASSVCDEPIKSPIHELITSENAVPSRSGSIIVEPENVPDMQRSKTSSKASSICDEPVKSPVDETIASANSVISRSGSVTEKPESIPDNITDIQSSKVSSKASSVCEEPIKSPVHEIANEITSISSTLSHETENTTKNVTGSEASNEASSVCDEPIKSSIHELITSENAVPSRSGSITVEPENVPDMQRSKTSSKASSFCDEPLKTPVDETIASASSVISRSGSVTEKPESIPDNVNDIQRSKASSKASSISDELIKSPVHEKVNEITSISSSTSHEPENTIKYESGSKASSKASSVCDEPLKSPVHETITSENAVPSRSGSIIETPENTPENVPDMQRSKTSSKANSICDEPVKSPVDETIASANSVISRSGSVTEKPESIPDNIIDIQRSKASSKASSVCEEPIKSPVLEIANEMTSISSNLSHEAENTTKNVTGSKASSKASSVCDEPIKSPIHETIISENSVPSRSGSITVEPENVPDIQRSKASSQASSICDEPVKSPVDETIASANSVISRSGSVTEKPESIPDNVTDIQRSKVSSKASSVCEELIKSPVHEIANEITSISSTLSHETENTTKNVTGSKASSKASSVCDEPIKSPIHELITSENAVPSRSGSIIVEPENVPDMQRSKTSSKASSICDEPVKSPVDETIASANSVISRSGSVTEKPESIPDNVNDIQRSKASSNASSVCDEPIKSPVHEIVNEITSLSSTLTHETENATKNQTVSKSSSKASSVCDEPVKSPVHETTTLINSITSSSNTISEESEKIPENETEEHGSKASSKSGSVCDELVKSPFCENKKSENTITNISSSIIQEPEIITDNNHCSKVSSRANSISEEPLKSSKLAIISTNGSESKSRSSSVNLEQDISHVSINDKQESGNSSVGQDTECPPIIGMEKYDVESCSRKDSFFQDKYKSSTFSSSSTSSICQEIDTQSSKLSSRKSSVIDESIDHPSKLHIGEKSSSLQESNVYEHNIDDNTKIFNKSGSLCDEMLNLPFNKVTENIISNKAYNQVVSPSTSDGKTESKMVNKIESICEKSIKSDNDEICTKEHLVSSTSSLILHETEEEKCQLPRKSSMFEEPQNLLTEDNNTILSPSDCNKDKSNVIEKKAEESKSFGRIGSLCEEIAKFLTDNDNKISTNITSESPCSLIESIPLKNNIDELKVETETLLQLNKNTDTLNKVENSPQLDDKVKVDEKYDNINEKNTDHSLPVKNITVSNNKPTNISTLLIEENNKTGIMNVAQMVGKNIIDESLTKHTVITDNESKSLKTVTPIANITSEECISKLSNVLIEDVVKTSDDKNIICDSSITDICMNQPLGVTLNSEDLGVTKDIVMQLKKDVHEALHQCSSDDERPFTPQSESSMSRSAMNIDEDDDDNEDNKIETDDDMPGSPMSTRPSPVQMQLDNRHVEINMDFNKALQEHRITRGEDLTTTEANGNHVTEIKTTEHDNINQNQGTSSDTVQSWGKPLGLPPVQSINNNGFDPIREWGKPLGLPSPTQPILELAEPQNMSSKTTPKKNVKKIIDNKPIINVIDKDAQNRIRRSESPSKLRSRSSSRMSRINPIYLDLIYVPHHGNSKYVSADFFKRVRARNYVFSGTDPSKEVLNALIEGKQAWEDQDLEVTIIPTYDTDTLGQWVAENEELLTKLKIDLSPSASRCTIKLQDHNTSCSAYRLEF
ncbi:microtubule-associated protein futsch [Metopolophium dirhodum]|uniref:microtubule-associated protein futsch n=1 Tax=Metopolophium dirhodum TaxID=44670 RepID=UPI00298F54B3|nr:microtubule-associated protein futsch [Metopolophium dirhodum]